MADLCSDHANPRFGFRDIPDQPRDSHVMDSGNNARPEVEAMPLPEHGTDILTKPAPALSQSNDLLRTASKHSCPSGSSADKGPTDDVCDIESGLHRHPTEQWSIFTKNQKRYIVFMIAAAGFFSPLSANIYFPALNTLARDFHVSSSTINLTLTSYMIFQGLAPTLFGELSDMAGRRPAYLLCFVIYIGACIGLACCKSYAALLILRCLQSGGSSGTIALASGVVADIATSAERGMWMGWATSGPMVAPAIAPVLGGVLAQFLGWRSIFVFLIIAAAVLLIPFAITFPETARNIVGNGSIPPQGWNQSLLSYLQTRKVRQQMAPLERTLSQRSADQAATPKTRFRFPNPFHVIKVVAQKDVGLLLFYNSIIYVAFMDVAASMPALLGQIYGYSALDIGLCFLPFGTGCMLSTVIVGKIMDWNFRRTARRVGMEINKGKANDLRSFPLERCRTEIALPLVAIGAVAILGYGWALQAETSIAAPLVLTFIVGLTLTGAFNCMSVMLVDLYPLSPATATAANNLVRCLMGAGGTAVIIYMIDAMGRGWCFTFIALAMAALSPSMLALQRWGPKWREARRLKLEHIELAKASGSRGGHEHQETRQVEK